MRRFAALGVMVLASALALATGTTFAAGAPTATTGAASSLADTQASLAGTVNPQGQLTSFAFQYGPTTSYGQQTALSSAGSGSADAPVTADLAGLTAGTTYHYRVIATNATDTAVGADQTFTTTGVAPAPGPKPGVTTGTASVLGAGATVNGAVNPNGGATSYYFELGTTAAYGVQTLPQDAGSGAQPVSVSAALSGLKASATYHYRIVAVGPQGAIATGDDATFSTVATSSRLALFGRTSFADQHGVGGVFLGCVGTVDCTGSLTLSRSGKALGSRAKFTIKANDGGFVHVSLNDLGKSLLRARGVMNVSTAVVNANGQKLTGKLKLVRFSTSGLRR